MNSTLKPGHWCRPKDEDEWNAILDLAEALGVFANSNKRQYSPFDNFNRVWSSLYADGVCAYTSSDTASEYLALTTSDFIRGVYALAGQKEPCRPGVEQRLDDHEKRIKALEAERDRDEFLKDECSKVIMPDGGVGRIVDSSVSHITVRSDQRQPWSITIDTSTSPKGIPFSVALEYMKAGRKVKRASWLFLKAAYILDDAIRFDGGIGPLSLGNGDLLATDWEVIPES